MIKKSLLRSFIVTAASLLILCAVSILLVAFNNNTIMKDELVTTANLIRNNYRYETDAAELKKQLSAQLVGVTNGLRLTVIDATGAVLCDTLRDDVSGMENHFDGKREEIEAALGNAPRTVKRKSESTGKTMLYYAVKIADPQNQASFVILRAAITAESVNSYVFGILPLMLVVLALSLGLSFFWTRFLKKGMMQPFALIKDSLVTAGTDKYVKVMPTFAENEINAVVNQINEISQSINNNISVIQMERQKTDFVLNNINQGVLAVSRYGAVEMANNPIYELFNADESILGKNIINLGGEDDLVESLLEAVESEKTCVYEKFYRDKVLGINVTNVENVLTNNLIKFIIIIEDITEAKAAEKLRSEFFANASHELKTPITAIQGFSELLLGAVESGTESEKYAGRIHSETQRLAGLVSDMLKLSNLESAQADEQEAVDLVAVCKDAANDLSEMASQRKTEIRIKGKGALNANPKKIYELVSNLLSNAVRYNKENGFVDVSVVTDKKNVVLKVKDTGIGVDPKFHSRIFERFFMVDKSRSKKTGGTGLGLSIVKHICTLYNAQIQVESAVNKGTAITIIF